MKLFESEGATRDHVPAWSPAPWRRTTTGPEPPRKTVWTPAADATFNFVKPVASRRRLPSHASVAIGLFQNRSPAAAPQVMRKAVPAML